MKSIVLGAVALACTVSLANAQQYLRPAYPPDWVGVTVSGGVVVSEPHLHTYNSGYSHYPTAYVTQPQVQYVTPQTGYVQPQVTYVQPQSVYVQNPHHTPQNLIGYWPFISKAHADRDFQKNWIHVYGGHR